jgi:hypothetical protein
LGGGGVDRRSTDLQMLGHPNELPCFMHNCQRKKTFFAPKKQHTHKDNYQTKLKVQKQKSMYQTRKNPDDFRKRPETQNGLLRGQF